MEDRNVSRTVSLRQGCVAGKLLWEIWARGLRGQENPGADGPCRHFFCLQFSGWPIEARILLPDCQPPPATHTIR